MTRYLVLRVPGSGPPALVGAPYDFATDAEAQARVADIEAAQMKTHHTHLEIQPYEGKTQQALADLGIIG